MKTLTETHVVDVPGWVQDLESFRRWCALDEFPEDGRVCYLNQGVWVDMSKEQVFSHVKVKTEFYRVLGNVVKERPRGHLFADGLRVTNTEVGFSVVPDGTYVSHKSLDTEQAELVEGADGGFVELEGTPDMTLVVVSDGSEKKDTLDLPTLYWEAGIAEYWLVDARPPDPAFDILQYSPGGYASARKRDGWMKSRVFGKSFRLLCSAIRAGHPEYTLEVR